MILIQIAAVCILATAGTCLLIIKVFRRPIEKQAFWICISGFALLAAIFTVLERLIETTDWLPFVCVSSLCVLAVLAVGFAASYLVGKLGCLQGAVLAIVVAALLGLCTGGINALLDGPDQEYPEWLEVPAALAAPGDFIANHRVLDGADWQGGEVWANGNEIAIWNAIVWSIVVVAVGCPIHLATRRFYLGCSSNGRELKGTC